MARGPADTRGARTAAHRQAVFSMQYTIDEHLASPEVTLDQHVRQSQIALACSLEGQLAIYLDVKYWIILRDAATGAMASGDALKLLRRLRELTGSRKAFCPISESTFAELFKQRDERTRRATAALVDELSGGVALVPFYDRMNLELRHFIQTRSGKVPLTPPQSLVWSRHGYVLGLLHPSATPFDPATELALQKAFFDYLWSYSLTEMVDQIGETMPPDEDRFGKLAVDLNAGNEEHAPELRSFEQTYSVELRGAIDLVAPQVAEFVLDVAVGMTGENMPRQGPAWDAYLHAWKSYLFSSFKSDDVKKALRTLHINTSLHASVRWNKAHKLEANDFYDFHHAAAALGYCDVFLTERPLKAMVTAQHVGLDKRYDCVVAANVTEALALLNS